VLAFEFVDLAGEQVRFVREAFIRLHRHLVAPLRGVTTAELREVDARRDGAARAFDPVRNDHRRLLAGRDFLRHLVLDGARGLRRQDDQLVPGVGRSELDVQARCRVGEAVTLAVVGLNEDEHHLDRKAGLHAPWIFERRVDRDVEVDLVALLGDREFGEVERAALVHAIRRIGVIAGPVVVADRILEGDLLGGGGRDQEQSCRGGHQAGFPKHRAHLKPPW